MTDRANASRRQLPRVAGFLGTAALTLGSLGGVAWAGGNGAQTFTGHAHGSDAAGLVVIDFNPYSPNNAEPGAPTLPAGCWMTPDEAFVSTTGNAVQHGTFNKTGGWFTDTYTGQADLWPLQLVNGKPVDDGTGSGNDAVDMSSGTPLATGHLTLWFGNEDNNKNGVTHATVTYNGVDINGNPVSLTGHFQFATNANGDVTAETGSITC